jgi:hypothetical protein
VKIVCVTWKPTLIAVLLATVIPSAVAVAARTQRFGTSDSDVSVRVTGHSPGDATGGPPYPLVERHFPVALHYGASYARVYFPQP